MHYSTTTEKYYEDKGILTSYDQFHFGEGLLGVKNFPQRMAEVLQTYLPTRIKEGNTFKYN